MRSRCNAPCFADSYYQKKGIKVCPEWDSFDTFIADMGPCPDSKYSIDRIDNDGNYCKDNCRWASYDTQARNKCCNIKASVFEEEGCLKDIAKFFGIKYSTLYMRRRRHPELSINELISFSDPRQEVIEWQGNYYTRKELCEMYGIPIMTFYDRACKGWSLEKILTQPIRKRNK
jgi:hypothetical protein